MWQSFFFSRPRFLKFLQKPVILVAIDFLFYQTKITDIYMSSLKFNFITNFGHFCKFELEISGDISITWYFWLQHNKNNIFIQLDVHMPF
jgi:hypothetical protein